MNAMTTALLLAAAACSLLTAVPAASGYRAVRTSGPLPVTVHVRSGGVVAGGPAANRTSAGGVVFPASVASSPTMTTTTTTTSTSTASAANAAAAAAAGFTSFSTSSSASNHTAARNQTRSERLRAREQYLFNVFEVIVSTLETKLQRIENLDKAVEHLMRRVEQLDSRVTNNIDKTEAVIGKLRSLDTKLFQKEPGTLGHHLETRLTTLDRKVGDIDTKLVGLKSQLDNNFLAPADDINAEASEKKPVNVHHLDVSKLLNTQMDNIRSNTANIDRKLQFHMNMVSDGLTKIISMVSDVHGAIVEQDNSHNNNHHHGSSRSGNKTTTTTPASAPERSNKIDQLVRQMHPILSVSEKMDEVWNVVVGTKSSVDDLVPKSDELLTQTQRQERAISDIHDDLRMNTNKIIANLDVVERRLKKQEDDVVSLAQRPVPAEMLRLDPTIDDYSRYDEQLQSESTPLSSSVSFTTPTSVGSGIGGIGGIGGPTPGTPADVQLSFQTSRNAPQKNRGVVFPSVKNKPPPANISFLTEQFNREVKGFSCLDLLNAGMKQSGVYYLQIRGTAYWYLKVFCEQEIADGGWTVIQRRDDIGDPIRENFNRDWTDYKNGFGDPTKEFWMGNENIYMLTSNDEYMLRIELEDFEGNRRYAQYSHFKIYSESEYYKLEIDGYEGNAGDSLNDPWYGSNNSPFSTYNRDNDRSSLNCASMLKGGWWWKSCGRGLNGLYLNDPQDLTARQGIVWFRWRGWDYTLKKAQMLIKPKATVIPPLPVVNAV